MRMVALLSSGFAFGLRGMSGSAPDSAVTFFCFAKRKSPKKRRAQDRAAARFLALLGARGVWLNSAIASNNASPDPLAPALLSPALKGGGGQRQRQTPIPIPISNSGACAKGCAFGCLAVWLLVLPAFPAVMRRRVAQTGADQGRRCLSEASFCAPRPRRATQCPGAAGRRIRLAFSLLTFFWRSKRK